MELEYKTLAIRILTKSAVENRQMFLDPDLTEDSKAELGMVWHSSSDRRKDGNPESYLDSRQAVSANEVYRESMRYLGST